MTKEFKPGRPKFAHARARTRWARHELGKTVVGLIAFYNNARFVLAVANRSMPCAVFDICPLQDTRGNHQIGQRLGFRGATYVRVRPSGTGKYVKNFSIHGRQYYLPFPEGAGFCVVYNCAGSSTTTVSLQPPLSEDPMVFP